MMKWSKRMLRIMIAMLAVLLISLSGVSGVMAKYVTQESIDGQVTLTADLGEIGIWETTVTYNADAATGWTRGSFAGQWDTYYSYPIIPGLDIPKDTVVRVDKDNNDDGIADAIVPAYVYLIVETDINSQAKGIQYTLENCWKLVDGQTNVYVYSDADGKPVAVSSSVDIPVLVDDHVFVSQYVYQNISSDVTQFHLKFSATMRQVISGQTAAQIYGSTEY